MRGKSPTCRLLALRLAVYDRLQHLSKILAKAGRRPEENSEAASRQVGDLPRIGVAKPSLEILIAAKRVSQVD